MRVRGSCGCYRLGCHDIGPGWPPDVRRRVYRRIDAVAARISVAARRISVAVHRISVAIRISVAALRPFFVASSSS